MTRVGWVTDPCFLDHRAPGHPERPERLARIVDLVQGSKSLEPLIPLDFDPIDVAALERLHSRTQIELVHDTASAGGGFIDHETYVRPNSFVIACAAAGAAASAARAVWRGDVRRAFAAIRPPGHHATDALSMGFCLFNNVALAAQAALDAGAKRVFILDWDVHHGNGTQDIFYARDDVVFCSVHQAGIFPGTGAPDERGVDAGRGHTINLPLPVGAGDDALIACMDTIIEPAVRRAKPDMLFLSAGYDAHTRDPLAGLEVTVTGFHEMSERLVALADDVCEGRLLACLEGGYDADASAWSAAATIAAMQGQPPEPDPWSPPVTPPPDIEALLSMARAFHGL